MITCRSGPMPSLLATEVLVIAAGKWKLPGRINQIEAQLIFSLELQSFVQLTSSFCSVRISLRMNSSVWESCTPLTLGL
ncbi:UNVERIFIED_CONTAM: hypothetical protein FKN15_017409 [Acipenser sinensis]